MGGELGGRCLVPVPWEGRMVTNICEGRDGNKQFIKLAHIFEKELVSATKGSELCSHFKPSFVLS